MTARAGRTNRRAAAPVVAALLAATFFSGAAAARDADPAHPLVATASGPVRGETADGVLVFRGIPYAAPPVAALRWMPPAPPASWREPRDARAFAPDCPGAVPLAPGAAEDCLYLNVWAGAASPAAKKPVMVWIYGGGYRGGSAAMPLFDGAALARAGVVLVSFGYRVGPLGFLAAPGLSAESPNGSSGNYGLLDAIAALRWVRQNIAAFGGDPGNVTIFGQSSGSETVNVLTASPLAKGLFHRAIGQSGSSFGVRRALPLAEAEKTGLAFMAERGAADVTALRALPLERVMADGPRKYEPNIDGWLLPGDVHALYRAGRQNDVPMLVGANAQEWGRPAALSPEALAGEIRRDYGALAPRVESLLGPVVDEAAATDARWRLTNLEWGDFPAATWAGLQSATGRAPVYRYSFDYAPPRADGGARTAHHGAELPYVFGTHRRAGAPPMGPADERLHALISRYWINFARTGDPNGAGLPQWLPERVASGRLMRFAPDGARLGQARDAALLQAIAEHHYGARTAMRAHPAALAAGTKTKED